MNKAMFQVGAPGIDAVKIVDEIQELVDKKIHSGQYSDPRVVRAERTNLANLQDVEKFPEFYLECLRGAVFVDIGDFEIIERRPRFARALVAVKRTIWQLLKFYTYRLWSQQNLVNGLLLSAIDGAECRNRDKLDELERRIAKLEGTGTGESNEE